MELSLITTIITWTRTTMQARLRCKHASEPPDPLGEDPTIDKNLALKLDLNFAKKKT
jgi:hypothetical protein